VAGHAINMPLSAPWTWLWLTLRSILLDTDLYGNILRTTACRPWIVAPRGCIANPFPAPTIARFARATSSPTR
jgi:hypothetical protein